MAQSERSQDQEPHHHDRPEIPSDTRCSLRLHHEECNENDPGGRQHIGLKACADAGCRQNALGRREHGDRRRYETVAIEQGRAAHAENENETGPASDDMLGQGHQGERSALTLVVGPQDEENIFHRHDQGESPKDQRDHPENSRFGGTRRMGQCLAHGIERARADVAEHHADRSERQRRKAVLCGCAVGSGCFGRNWCYPVINFAAGRRKRRRVCIEDRSNFASLTAKAAKITINEARRIEPATRKFNRAGGIFMTNLYGAAGSSLENLYPLRYLSPAISPCRGRACRADDRSEVFPMMDLLMLALGLGFFALSIAYTYACDQL